MVILPLFNIYTYMTQLSKYNWSVLLKESQLDESFPLKSMEYIYPIIDCDLEDYISTHANQEVMQNYYNKLVQAGFITENNEVTNEFNSK